MNSVEWKHSMSMAASQQPAGPATAGSGDCTTAQKDDTTSAASTSSDVDYAGISGLKEFFGETTMHGVQYLFRGVMASKVIWLLGVLGCLAGFLFFFITAIINYLDYQSNTKIQIQAFSDAGLPVPVISICNTNFAQLAAVNPRASPNSSSVYANLVFLCAGYNFTNTTDCPFSPSEITDLLRSETRTPQQILTAIGQPKEDMFLDPLIDSFPNFVRSTAFVSGITNEGICNTYNINGDDLIATTGLTSGRQFLINVNQNQYAGITVLSAGVEVYLHNQNEPIVRGRNAIYVGPGQRANIALLPERRELLGPPFNNPGCTNKNLNRNTSLPYTYNRCQLECKEQVVAEECGCLPFTVPRGTELTTQDGQTVSTYCDVFVFNRCSAPILSENATVNFFCSALCPEPCKQNANHFHYDYRLSYDLFPNNALVDLLVAILVRNGLYAGSNGVANTTYMRDNFAQVNIYYDEAGYSSIVEQPASTLTSLFGSVGGNFGLFLGASMLTLLEFAQYFLRMAIARVQKLRGSRRSNDLHGGSKGKLNVEMETRTEA